MTGRSWSRFGAYAGAAGFAASAELLRFAARSLLGGEAQLLFVYFPFLLAAVTWLGLGPGLFCTALSVLGVDWFWLEPTRSLAVAGPRDVLLLVLYSGAAVVMCFLVAQGRSSRARGVEHRGVLERESRLREETSAYARDGEARLEAILNTAAEAILTIDERGIVESANPAAERIFGYTAAEMVGQNVRMLMPAPYRDEHDGYLRAYLDTGDKKVIGIGREVEGRRKDGSAFPLHLSVSEVRLGGARCFTGFIHDLTEQKRLEREFLQSQKMEAVGSLAGGIAHDFNNLLMGILACSRMAGAGLERGSEAHELFQEVSNAARRGIALTRRLLSFTRRQPAQLRPTSINAVLRESETMLRQLLGEDISLRLDLASSGAHVRADDGLIDQILVNLLVNARDAMPSGGEIVITTRERESEGHAEVELLVRDPGSGMPPEVLGRIFEPFFSTKGIERGTGLGLSTVKRIVEQLAGRIEVDSAVGRGTTFRLTFARVEAGAAGTARTLPERLVPRPSRKNVLLVEDDRLVRSAIQRFLTAKGWNVIAADGSAAALDLAAGNEIDVLVTDMVLPGLAGNDLAMRIRSRAPNTKVIYMSAHPAEVLVSQGRLAHGVPYLEKPFEMELLEDLLGSVVHA